MLSMEPANPPAPALPAGGAPDTGRLEREQVKDDGHASTEPGACGCCGAPLLGTCNFEVKPRGDTPASLAAPAIRTDTPRSMAALRAQDPAEI